MLLGTATVDYWTPHDVGFKVVMGCELLGNASADCQTRLKGGLKG